MGFRVILFSIYGGTHPFWSIAFTQCMAPLGPEGPQKAMVAASKVLQMGYAEAAADRVLLAPRASGTQSRQHLSVSVPTRWMSWEVRHVAPSWQCLPVNVTPQMPVYLPDTSSL